MEAKKILVKQLFHRGFYADEIFNQLKCLGVNNVFIYRTINRLLDTNSCKDRAWPGCLCSDHTKEFITKNCGKM